MCAEVSGKQYPDSSWFMEQTSPFKKRWDEAPWHENGDKVLKSVIATTRKYASHLNELPGNFLPSIFDQHLAVVSEGYEYQVFDILESVGDDRYLCLNDTGESFLMWSRSITKTIGEGASTVFTAVIRLGEGAGFVNAITYGPVLSWSSLSVRDFSRIGSELSRDLMRIQGLPAVIRRDPVPFWALWTLGAVPRIMHAGEEFCTCWCAGSFLADPQPILSGGWKRDVIGKRVRYCKPGSKPYFEQNIIWDTTTLRGIVLTHREGYWRKLKNSLSSIFTPDSESMDQASITLSMAFSNILKKELQYSEWTRPFERLDERRAEEERRKHPEREAELSDLEDAMKELVPYINSGKEPDWGVFTREHGLDSDSVKSLQAFYKKYSR